MRFAVGVHPHQAHLFAADPAGAAAAVAARLDASPLRPRHRRDRARLPLRLLAARRAAGGLPRAARAGPGARPAGGHPHARGRGRHAAADLPRRRPAGRWRGVFHCFTGDAARGASGRWRPGFYLSFAGILTFPRAVELREARARRAARPAAGRDRRAVSGAGAAPRQAQRAGLRRATAAAVAANAGWPATHWPRSCAPTTTGCSPTPPANRTGTSTKRRRAALTPARRYGRIVRFESLRAEDDSRSAADVRAGARRPRRGRARVSASGRVEGRRHPEDWRLHPEERRQARPPGACC